MPLFRCSQCNTVENTALCMYWIRRYEKQPTLCSQCERGQWHGLFPREDADAAGYMEKGDGFLVRLKEGGE